MVSYHDIMRILADGKTMNLFVCISSADNENIITNLRLTRKQYYSRLSELIKSGLIHRKKGRYYLTTFGKIVYDALMHIQLKIEYAIDNIWKLKAIDSLEVYEKTSKEELERIIDALLDNNEIKDVIIKEPHSSSSSRNLITKEMQK
jgi:predicted transcriptional regulator